jgi:Fe-S-cluster-containing hydrogenase component 2
MKVVKFLSVVDPEKCNGDKRCEKLCPAGAIKVVERIAVVDENRCVACGKCKDVCREEAIEMIRRPKPLEIAFDVESVDQEKIRKLCAKVPLLPDMLICSCTGTMVREVAAAIIGGARSPEDIVLMTGAGSGCGIYCMGLIFKMFQSAGIEIPDDPRWNNLPLCPQDIPDEIAEKYPQYHFRGHV